VATLEHLATSRLNDGPATVAEKVGNRTYGWRLNELAKLALVARQPVVGGGGYRCFRRRPDKHRA
jgi:hypothetical protein